MVGEPEPLPHPPPEGRVSGLLAAVKGLTLSNVLVIALLAIVAVPVYIVYRALNDEEILDRLMSSYDEVNDQKSGCLVRHVQTKGGPDQWGVSSGFAFQGVDRWFVSVIINQEPTPDDVASYCESLKLIADRMLSHGPDERSGDGEVLTGPVPGAKADGGGRDRLVPTSPPTPTEAKE